MKIAYIIHGWGGNPEESWFPWLKKELEKVNYKVEILAMPNPDYPTIKQWVGKLNNVVDLSQEVYMIGHSIGCQAILRYLENLEGKIKHAILVAPWLDIKNLEEGEDKIAKPWVETKINLSKVRRNCEQFSIIYSTSDPYPYKKDIDFLKKELNAKFYNVGKKGHINSEYGVFELPEVLSALDIK